METKLIYKNVTKYMGRVQLLDHQWSIKGQKKQQFGVMHKLTICIYNNSFCFSSFLRNWC